MNGRLRAIQRRFDRSGADGSYDAHARVQRLMSDSLSTAIARLTHDLQPGPINILEIGCGTGALTEKLAELFPEAAITALDLAPAMLESAKQRLADKRLTAVVRNGTRTHASIRAGQMNWILSDIDSWLAEQSSENCSFDLIVSNACFQWLPHPAETLSKLARLLLRPGGSLAFTTFGPHTFHELHQSFADAYSSNNLPPQRHGLSFRSSEQWQLLLMEAGFTVDIAIERNLHCERHASVRDFLLSIKAVGASTSEALPVHGISRRVLFTQMYRSYEARYRASDNSIPATYDLMLLHACTRS